MLYITATMLYGYAGPLPSGDYINYSCIATIVYEVLGSAVDLSEIIGGVHDLLRDRARNHVKADLDNAEAQAQTGPLSFSHSFVRL